MARPAGLEPATPGLEGRCSIQLSYGRLIIGRVHVLGMQETRRAGLPGARDSSDAAL